MKKTTLPVNNSVLTSFFLLISIFGYSQSPQTYTASGTFTVPAGVTTLTIEAWGGGGRGGTRTSIGGGGGGGGGAYARKFITVTSGNSYTVTVGAGSTISTSSGGDSWFGTTGTILAKGGNSVANNAPTGATGGASGSSIGDFVFSGGNGAAASASKSGGGGGSSAGNSLNGVTSTNASGAIAPLGGGDGGNARSVDDGNGTIGSAPGGGGGGAYSFSGSTRNGGNGANGKIVITWGAKEISVQGNTINIVSGDITPNDTDGTDFSSLDISSGIIYKSFTIYNLGSDNLTVNSISLSGSSDFTVSAAPIFPAVISGKNNVNFVVGFDPSSTGTKTATISISNNDSNESTYTFKIKGEGIQTFYDSDGDGIFDNVDIDDDNDGIKDITEEANCNNSNGYNVNYKFLNETFGSGARTTINTTYAATTTYCYEDGTVGTNTADCPTLNDTNLNDGEYTVGPSALIASWALGTSGIWHRGGDHTGDPNGRMAMFNADYTSGVFYTALITGALAQIPITYSFWVLNLDRSDAGGIATRLRPNIKVEFRDLNDNLLASINTGQIAPTSAGNIAGDWYNFKANLVFNVSAFKVIFINNETGGLGNDLAIDDIVITQTLCDKDGDGVPDLFDLDCDNDGIEDVIEAGLGNLSNGKGKIDVTWVDANGNGLLDSAQSTANLPALDSDGDGVPNYHDLDSDNDSLFDVDESGAGNTNAATGYANGDGDINGDGVGDGLETEVFRSKDFDGNGIIEGFGDGILDIYDYGIVAGATTSINSTDFKIAYGNLNQGTTYPTYLKNSDADGIPDYLDLKSNGSTFDIANSLLIYDYKIVDSNNDGKIDGTADIDKDGIMDSFDTNTAYFGSPRDLRTKLFLEFDGRNDYGQSTAILGGLANASLMGWINLNSAFSTDGVIVGQNNFQIRITSSKTLEAVVNGISYPYNTALNVSQWYNVAATYDGTNLKLYLNGALVLNQAKSGAISADTSLLTIGRDPGTNGPTGTKYFKGKIDEVRIFNVALTDSQLQRMVYQEIKNSGSEIRGEIVPKNIATSPASLPFANLLRYYRMDTYKDDIVDDLTTSSVDSGTGMKIYNHKNIYVQQAPMPFVTEQTGNFATAVNSTTKEIRGADIMDYDWSIVKVQHDITAIVDNIDLGMIVNPGKNIVMNSDTNIQNDWYLKLDGTIDLQGKSQLLQTIESDLEASSTGWIERDQQGQANKYNYNYWSSPVSPKNSIDNKYTVDVIMKDGFNAIPRNINWVSGYDGTPGSTGAPVKLARYWLYKFESNTDAYANWIQITETSELRAGQGYTLKGSGAASNFTFVGKPNNGTISNTVGSGQLLLIGNPYPSAINADKFLDDNLTTVGRSAIDGTLYFWQHAPENNTHILANYLGSYGVLNRSGGIAAVTPSAINGQGTAGKIPKRDIPVGQGFFVYGTTAGGVVEFKNSQRIFAKETDATSNALFKTMPVKDKIRNDNNNDSLQNDTFKRIRLGFDSNNNYHRQVLLAFMEEKATSGIDDGYDGYMFDDFPNDMCLLNGVEQLVIEGEGFFDASSSYPIGVKTDTEGKVKFMLDGLENFDTGQAIYIHDSITDIYHDIRNEAFEINLPEGENNTRFSLRFTNRTLGVAEKTIKNIDTITTAYLKNENILIINNNLLDIMVKKVSLFNSIGQSIISWKIENQEQQNIKLPVKKISSGVYIAKIQTTKGDLSKKIIIP